MRRIDTLWLTTALALMPLAMPAAMAHEPAAAAQTAPPPTDAAATSESARLNRWFDAKFEEQLAFSPITQTFLGRKTDNDKIDDFSLDAADRQLQWLRDATAEMQASFDYAALTPETKISWDLWLYNLAQAEAAVKYRSNEYMFTQMQGMQSFLPSFLIDQHVVESEADMTGFISRLRETARALDQLLARAQANAAAGTRPPRFAYEGVIDQSVKVTTGAPFDDGAPSALWSATEEKLAALVAKGVIDQARSDELAQQARTALTDALHPAYQRLITWLREDMANSDAEARGVAALNDGEAFYNHMLANQTTSDLTADAVHNIGLAEVARIRGEMEVIKDKVGFDGDLQAFFAFLRTDDRFYFSDDDKGAQDYIAAAEGHLNVIKARLPEFFGLLPKADLVVKRVEPFREQDGAAQHYRSGTPDGSRPGTYYAHLSDMRAMPIHLLEVIAYHEGNPGHHMQISISQELEGVPKFRSQGGGFNAYVEGWALYSELLAKDMGAYSDPYSDFGRLTSEMWRAIRLVVDTGIHSKGWGEEQAVQYMLANSAIAETAVRSEIQRYIVWPGQATGYKIGMLKILELRAKAQAALGDDFDIRGFHDTVLGGGALPLSLLEKQVDQWIAARLAD